MRDGIRVAARLLPGVLLVALGVAVAVTPERMPGLTIPAEQDHGMHMQMQMR